MMYDPSCPPSDRCPHPLIRVPSVNCATPWPGSVLSCLCRSPPPSLAQQWRFFSYTLLPLHPSLSLSISFSSNYFIVSPPSLLITCKYLLLMSTLNFPHIQHHHHHTCHHLSVPILYSMPLENLGMMSLSLRATYLFLKIPCAFRSTFSTLIYVCYSPLCYPCSSLIAPIYLSCSNNLYFFTLIFFSLSALV